MSDIILPEYVDDFANSEFVPYPSAQDAVEMILETACEIIGTDVRIKFYEDILKGVNEALQYERFPEL